jgi:DNA-binding XRE family transcriptional regulator
LNLQSLRKFHGVYDSVFFIGVKIPIFVIKRGGITVKRKLTKNEIKGIRVCLGMSREQFAKFLNVSADGIKQTESHGDRSYNVSDRLDKLVKAKLEELGINLEEILESINQLEKLQERLRK